jgi:type IV pilus assembly protein PilA
MSASSRAGFTMLELLAVMLVVAILATIAVPSVADRIVMSQVSDGLTLTAFVKSAVQAEYTLTQKFPVNNVEVSLPPSDHIVSNVVADIAVQNGAINITFGNQANPRIRRHVLTLRPAVVPNYPQVPITWVCARAPVPTNMVVNGTDLTDLPNGELPFICRG